MSVLQQDYRRSDLKAADAADHASAALPDFLVLLVPPTNFLLHETPLTAAPGTLQQPDQPSCSRNDNLARLGDATQSSTYRPEYNAGAAIDGNKVTNMMLGSCSHTNNDNPAWWRLDLKKRYKVDKVVIVNRGDCCDERLLGAQIHIGNSANNNNPICGSINSVSEATITLSCHGMEGQYVSVVIPGRAENLQLCEVEVYGQEVKCVAETSNRHLPINTSTSFLTTTCLSPLNKMPTPPADNLARLGDATQSSTYRPEYNAGAAIDGNKVTNMMLGSCSHTNNDNPAWWRLDLKKRYKVDKVVIVNRGDCCAERLLGAQIHIGNSANNKNPICGSINSVSEATITLSCHGMEGQYVSVVIPGRAENLQLCEVEVYGQEVKAITAVNVARWGSVSQSSTYRPEYSAETAIDGDKETNIFMHPCAHTNPDNPAWWQLDLKTAYMIESVVIVNRGDCCSERLLGAQIRVGNSPFHNNPVCGTITDVSETTITLSCHKMEGRYVSVVIPGRAEYLHICEVEVYGVKI
ncbi:hypothetical protein XELAEV_18032484mg [Xenopus laevis]|uniref:Fucolectin tachylectin-4 pentraxin-1 domain-containing protein n=1 Tax=Xenopus laevis TaxID=8355 RepID=A0A974HGQ0_XENLA|nr:hypothetical protein XELAEV_18032484mg [Xenopus laevis]